MKAPAPPWFIHHIRDVVGSPERLTTVLYPTTRRTYRAMPVRAIGAPAPWTRRITARCRAAFWVLTGRAVALQWPKDGELEIALHGPCAPPDLSVRPVLRTPDTGDAA